MNISCRVGPSWLKSDQEIGPDNDQLDEIYEFKSKMMTIDIAILTCCHIGGPTKFTESQTFDGAT